ncbi:16175_t:CDS:2 [Funneliformis mosseae]|uniref:16175_t:CDS:1 n=1 Tax=Funneliformis mosseae TaxID=27381 RepID=A0A9N9EZF5_FUNMO|nr:16175_t:CDS:2 [Funneliformis mosseae]
MDPSARHGDNLIKDILQLKTITSGDKVAARQPNLVAKYDRYTA